MPLTFIVSNTDTFPPWAPLFHVSVLFRWLIRSCSDEYGPLLLNFSVSQNISFLAPQIQGYLPSIETATIRIAYNTLIFIFTTVLFQVLLLTSTLLTTLQLPSRCVAGKKSDNILILNAIHCDVVIQILNVFYACWHIKQLVFNWTSRTSEYIQVRNFNCGLDVWVIVLK